MQFRTPTLTIATIGLLAAMSNAETVSVSIENTLGDGGFFFTPVWIAAHDGSFDTYNSGQLASDFPGLTALAENGNTGPLSAAFASSTPGGVDATVAAFAFDGDAPVYSPGESASFSLDVGDAAVNRYFSYASMIVPSNDLFFANGNPTAVELFDALGNFNGTRVIEIYGRDINDNGTELNSAGNDAAFSTNDGQSVPESEFIRDLFSVSSDSDYLSSFIGSTTANGASITSAFGADDLVARITITQVPAPGGLLTLAGAGFVAMRRRRV